MSTAEVTAIATRQVGGGELASAALTIQDLIAQKKLIAQAMSELMKPNEHYGVIPGTGKRKDADGKELPPKPSLLKPGADLIGFMFSLDAEYETEEVIHEAGYIYYRIKCTLTHIPTGKRRGSGMGSCNSREEKYRRAAAKKCPRCGKETIIKGKEEYGGGWLCFEKKGGCKAKWPDGAAEIEQQETGIADPSDLDNTILKMALKRARIDAILTATAASDFFTQDVEDLASKEVEYTPPAPAPRESAGPKASAGSAVASPPDSAASVLPAAQTAPKAPRANTVKHDGVFANHKQVALLHILRSKVGGLDVCSKEPCYDGEGKRINPTRKMCQYHTQLAAFKDCDNRPIRSSKELSEKQISNLIDRYEAKIKQQEARASETPEIPFADIAAPVGMSASADAGSPARDDELSELRAALDERSDASLLDAICETFRCDTIDNLPKHEAPAALALVLAWGTKSYAAVLERVRP